MKNVVITLLLILTGLTMQAKAAEASAVKTDKTCWAFASSKEQLKVPFSAFCYNQLKNEVYFYDKFALRTAAQKKNPTRVENVSRWNAQLVTQLSEEEMSYPYEINSLFILTTKGTMIFIDKYNYDFEGELVINGNKYQYERYEDIE